MSLTLEEIIGSDATLDPKSLTIIRKFRVKGQLPYTHGGDAFNYVANQVMGLIRTTYPNYVTPYGTLHWNSIQLHEDHYAILYQISVTYSPNDRQSGTYQLSVDDSAGSVHITAGRLIETYAAAAADKRPQGGAIGVDGDEVRGCDISVAEMKISVQFRHPQAFLNRNYIIATGQLIGYPNNDAFLGFQAGEVVYMGGPKTQSDCECSATYNFAVSYNATNLVIGGITVSDKKGWDVISPYYEPATNTNGAGTVHAQRKLKSIDIVRPREWKDYVSVFGWGA